MNLTISIFGRKLYESDTARMYREYDEQEAERQRIIRKNSQIAKAAMIQAEIDRDRRAWERKWEQERWEAEKAAKARRIPCSTWTDSDMQIRSTC